MTGEARQLRLFGTRPLSCSLLAAALLLAPVTAPGIASAAVTAATFADVSGRGFAAVWASTESVSDATLRVYADAAGVAEISSGLSIGAPSDASPASLAIGLVRVEVSGLTPGTCVYVQTITTGTTVVSEPAAPSYPEVCTANGARRSIASGAPLLNDLVSHPMLLPDLSGTATGAILLASLPGLSSTPMTAFAAVDFAAPQAVVDLSNAIDDQTGTTLPLDGGERMKLVELRGLHCAALQDHALVRFRKVPDHEETPGGPRLVELEAAVACHPTDPLCDDVVDVLDLQHALNALGTSAGDCAFNPDLDLDTSGAIDGLDVQDIVDDFGQSAPFSP